MWKTLNFLHRAARGGLRVSVREEEQGKNLLCLSQEHGGSRVAKTPFFTIPCLENSSKECRTLVNSQLQRISDCQLVDNSGKGYQDNGYYEDWTPSEALKNIFFIVLLYNIVHLKDLRNETPDWMCPYLVFGNNKSLYAQPLQLNPSNIAIKQQTDKHDAIIQSLEPASIDAISQSISQQGASKHTPINDEDFLPQLEKGESFSFKKPEAKSVQFSESEFGYELDALEGIELLNIGSPRGITKLLELSRLGSSVASFHLGMAYESGYLVSQDIRKARRYYEKSARLGNPDAEFNLAVYYSQGRGGLVPDHAKARQLLKSAASKGSEAAHFALQKSRDKKEQHNSAGSSSSTENSDSTSSGFTNEARGVHLYELGRSFEELGEIGAALEFYNQACDEGYGKAREARQRLNSGSGSS